MFRISQLFAVLEMVTSNSSMTNSIIDTLSDASSLGSVFDNVQMVSNSCKFTVCLFCDVYCRLSNDSFVVNICKLLL